MNKLLSRSFRSSNRDALRARRPTARRNERDLLGDHEPFESDVGFDEGDDEDEDNLDHESPFDAVARRLKRSNERLAREEASRRHQEQMRARERSEPVVDAEEIAETAAALVTRRVEASERQTAKALESIAELIETGQRRFDPQRIDEAVAEFERRAEATERKTAKALDNIAELIETNVKTAAHSDFDTLKDRLGRIESKITKAPVDENRPIRNALARLELRIDRISKDDRAEGFAHALSGLDERLSQIAARLEEDARDRRLAPPPPPAPEPVERAARSRDLDYLGDFEDRAPHAPYAAKRPLAEAIADITRRQQALDEAALAPRRAPVEDVPTAHRRVPVEEVGASAFRAPPQAQNFALPQEAAHRFDKLHVSMDALAQRLETQSREDAEAKRLAAAFGERLEALGRQIEQLARAERPDPSPRWTSCARNSTRRRD